MSACPRCGIPGGGGDRNGRALPNHICGAPLFGDGLPVVGAPTAEQVARRERFSSECQQIVAQLRRDLAAQREKEIADESKEEARQQEMRKRVRAFVRDLELAKHNLSFDVKE